MRAFVGLQQDAGAGEQTRRLATGSDTEIKISSLLL